MAFLAEVIQMVDLFPLPVPGLHQWGVNSALEGERREKGSKPGSSPAPSLACRAEPLFPVSLGRTERSAGVKAALDKPFS